MTEQTQDQTQPEDRKDLLDSLTKLMRSSSKMMMVSKVQETVWPTISTVGRMHLEGGNDMIDLTVDALVNVATTMVYFGKSGVAGKLFTVKDKGYRQELMDAHNDNLHIISGSEELAKQVRQVIDEFIAKNMKPVEDIGPPPADEPEVTANTDTEVNADTDVNGETLSNESVMASTGTDGENVPT